MILPIGIASETGDKRGSKTLKETKLASHAFTLVELVVVIVVIGLLATIGAISYSGVQFNTRDSQRSS